MALGMDVAFLRLRLLGLVSPGMCPVTRGELGALEQMNASSVQDGTSCAELGEVGRCAERLRQRW